MIYKLFSTIKSEYPDQHNGLIDDVNALKAKDAKVEALEAEVAQLREELKEFKELLKKGKVK